MRNKMQNKEIMAEIRELIVDDFTKTYLQRFLNLAILVDNKYKHIEQLETLKTLFEGGLSDYYKQYHIEKHKLCVLVGQACQNTFMNHYKKKSEKLYPSIYDVQMEIFGEENKYFSESA